MMYGQNPVVLKNSDFETANFENLSFLRDELSDVKLLALGESSHYMGGTYTAKIKMVKYLHEHCNFDVIAFEMPMYNLNNLNTSLEKGQLTPEDLFKNVSGVWGTLEMMELYNYIIETQESARPLKIAGFDDNFFGKSKLDNLPRDYALFLESLRTKSGREIKTDTLFFNALDRVVEKSYSFKKANPSDTLELNQKFKEITDALKSVDYSSDKYFFYWKRLTDNLQSVYRKNYRLSNRDKQMYHNVKFLSDICFKDDKIILWGATVHLMYNFQSIDDKYYKDKNDFMGCYLKADYKQNYYCMAFTALKGKIGFRGYLGLGKFKIKTRKGSVEYFIDNDTGADFAYISMRKENIKQIFIDKHITKSSLLGIKELKMDISEVVDGIFYLKNERLVTFK